jgi:DNA-binding NtrC family response regulator
LIILTPVDNQKEITIMAQALTLSPVSMAAARASHFSCARHETSIVFVVDDDASVRESVASLLDAAGLASATFGSATEFLATPRPTCLSCLILDVMMPDLNGLELQERLTAAHIDLPIIFITAYGDIPMTVRAMKGAPSNFSPSRSATTCW